MRVRNTIIDALGVVVLSSSLVAATPIRAVSWVIGQPVQTTSGLVQGHAASTASQVSEYLGIPYAQPPVGNLRFQPPAKFAGSSTINGSTFPTVNASIPDGFANLGVPTSAVSVLGVLADPGSQSEDCLTLNVWTKPQVGEEKKAVMVWIHGGAFMLGKYSLLPMGMLILQTGLEANPIWLVGSSRVPATNGQFITDQSDVILVSLK
ncbi:carboxylesterase [Colletotrichum higginsianum]|nr:carboxylesterase [Colletotrichum higginsianum]